MEKVKTTQETYLTVEEVATLLKVSDWTVRRWVSARKIPYLKINGNVRFVERHINQWIESKSVKPKAA